MGTAMTKGRKANVQANRFWNMRSRRVGTLRMIVITGKDVIARCQAESWHLAIGVTHQEFAVSRDKRAQESPAAPE
jgi:hypothetical protein